MSWTCERCHTSNEDDRYQCKKCKGFNPMGSEAHTRWNDWKCAKCGESNGGGFRTCYKCGAKR